MKNKTQETTYKIEFKTPRKITKGKDLYIRIYIKLTPEELELMKRQQLQLNEQMFMEGETVVQTMSYTFMIEHFIKKSKKKIKEKIEIDNEEQADREILKKYMQQLLDLTEKHILKSKTVQELMDQNK